LRIISARGNAIPIVTGAHALACLALLGYLCRSFGLSAWLLAIHAPLVLAAFGAALLPAALVLRLARGRRAAPYAAAGFPVAVTAALAVLYAGNLVTYQWLGAGFTRTLAALWIQDWWGGRQLQWLLSAHLIAAIAIAAALALLVDLLAWAWALRGWQPGLPSRPVSAVVAVAILTCGYAAPLSGKDVLAADPIIAFVRGDAVNVDVRQQMVFDQLRQDEPRRRAAYGRHPFDRKNVIVITVDSLRPDHMQAYGYRRATTPFLSRLHAGGKLRQVRLATSTCAESNCGIVSTLFSRTLRHQVPEDFSLFNLLKDQGYDTHFVLSGNHNWQGLRDMYGHEMTSYFDGTNSSRWGWSDDRVLLEGLERIDNYQRPSFFYFHLMSAHILGNKEARYRRFTPAVTQLDMPTMFRRGYDRARVVNSYDNGVLQADDTIRQLFGVLDRKGYLHNSIVVITADHGEALAERADGMYGHINWLYQELITIPMLIYDESPAEYRGLAYGTQLDVAPTIVDRLGLPIPDGWEGVSLLDETRPRQTIHQTKLTRPCFAIVDYTAAQTWKYMQCASGREELYDLTHDPLEQYSLTWKGDAVPLQKFRTDLANWQSR
jgi:arylsulfatase A-like enzyme